jgi:hypothetical protein
MQEAYRHEVSSCGYWPGGAEQGAFYFYFYSYSYSYAYPEPEGFPDRPVEPADAVYDGNLKEFILPYQVVRSAEDPDATLLTFAQSTYEAAVELGDWDRAGIERATQR